MTRNTNPSQRWVWTDESEAICWRIMQHGCNKMGFFYTLFYFILNWMCFLRFLRCWCWQLWRFITLLSFGLTRKIIWFLHSETIKPYQTIKTWLLKSSWQNIDISAFGLMMTFWVSHICHRNPPNPVDSVEQLSNEPKVAHIWNLCSRLVGW